MNAKTAKGLRKATEAAAPKSPANFGRVPGGLIHVPASRAPGVEFDNSGEIIAVRDEGKGYAPGQVYFANDTRFLETYFSEPLTNYAVGWKDPNDLQSALEFIAPSVPVGRRFEWKKANNAEEFLSEISDDQRAIGSDFKRVDYTQTDVTDKTLNKGLMYVADLDQFSGTQWQNQKVAKLLRRLWRNEYRRGIALLTSTGTNQAYTWDTTSGKNPDRDLLTDLITAETASGIRPNRVVYGQTAFNKRGLSYEAQTTSTAFGQIAALNLEQLAERLMVDEVRVDRARYQSSSSAKSEIVSNLVFGFFAESGVDTEDPSHFKRFVSEFDAEQGGGFVRVYVQQLSSKLVAITVEHYSKIVATFTTGVRKWTIS